jgi:hypothetical protein
MASQDRLLLSELHGTAWRHAAEQLSLSESIAELGEMAAGRNDILAEAAGIQAESWYASPATHVGHELICAGMSILASGGNGAPLDYGELERWARIAYGRGVRSRTASAESSQRDNSDSGR